MKDLRDSCDLVRSFNVYVFDKLGWITVGLQSCMNIIKFMQLWSPTVIHPSLSKTYTLKDLDPQQQMYPQRNLLECFSRWLNQPSHASLSLLFPTSKE